MPHGLSPGLSAFLNVNSLFTPTFFPCKTDPGETRRGGSSSVGGEQAHSFLRTVKL